MSEWISVKDRLPDFDGVVLIHAPSADYETPFIAAAWYNPDHGFEVLPKCWIVSHWMPLPEPPKDIE